MYEKHFGLRQRPFRATPDSASYYPATTHEQALARLVQGVADDEGLLLLTGAPGLGKTLVCHRLLERLGAETSSAFLTNSHVNSPAALLQSVLYDLGLAYEGRGDQELRLALTDFLLKNFGEGRRTVLIVDEAQHLSGDVLEELRLLGNLEAGKGKAIQVILVAQPALLDKFEGPQLAAFRQRLVVRVQLQPLSLEEAGDYVLHHLRAAGARPEAVVSEEALELLAQATAGIPRLLNQAAHQALTLAHAAGAELIDAEAALEALAVLGLEVPEEEVGGEESLPRDCQAEACTQDSNDKEESEQRPLLPLANEEDDIPEFARRPQRNLDRAHRLLAPSRRPA